jgi:hypothetical protein
MSNRERVSKGLDELKTGLVPFIEREFKAKLGTNWETDLPSRVSSLRREADGLHWDTQAVLRSMTATWSDVFRFVLGPVEHSYVGELIEVRNHWAHEKPFTSDDVDRALDTAKRLLQSVSASEQVEAVEHLRMDLRRQVFDEQARNKVRYQNTLEGAPQSGLKPWREVMMPHRDVASGTYM